MNSNFLSSWKQISAYTGFTERTLQRWEQRFGFPVHRPAGKAHSAVSALATEIEAWLSAAPSIPEIRQTFVRYPGKLSDRPTQRLEEVVGTVSSSAESPSFSSPSIREQRAAVRSKPDGAGSAEAIEALLSGVCLMKQLAQEQARRVAELGALRAEFAKTRAMLARALRESKLPQSPFISIER